jgi:hypothetical protein
MISQVNGEVSFQDGLCIGAHSHLAGISTFVVSSHEVSIPGWSRHPLGIHRSNHGEFDVHAIVGDERRVEALYLSHSHSYYSEETPDDAERRIYHEGVIAADLCGQHEFGWGQIFCRYETIARRDWIWVVYNPFTNVPLRASSIEMILAAHEPLPTNEDTVT